MTWKCGGLSVRPSSPQPALGGEADGGLDGILCHSHCGTHHEEEMEVMEERTRMSLNAPLTLRLPPPKWNWQARHSNCSQHYFLWQEILLSTNRGFNKLQEMRLQAVVKRLRLSSAMAVAASTRDLSLRLGLSLQSLSASEASFSPS